MKRLLIVALLGWALAAAVVPGKEDRPRQADASLRTATFSMYCYWTGEATIGRVDGVVASRIGHWGGNEIVQVDYDPGRTDVGALAGALKRQRAFYSLLVADEAECAEALGHLPAGEVTVRGGRPRFIAPKHSLRTVHPRIAALDLSEEQAIALNSWSYFGGPMPDVLTEEQKRQLEDR
jgi:hypothetical protein